MKKIILIALTVILPLAAAQAEEIRSAKTQTKVARIAGLHKLSKASDEVAVNLVVVDLGGSTDVSPTKRLHLTIYRKGEMYSTDASFALMEMLELKGVKRIANGIYLVIADTMTQEGRIEDSARFRIDARKAIAAIAAVRCNDFDCEASENFASTISMVRE